MSSSVNSFVSASIPFQLDWETDEPKVRTGSRWPFPFQDLPSHIATQDSRFMWLADGLGLLIHQGTWHRSGRLTALSDLDEPCLQLHFFLNGHTVLRVGASKPLDLRARTGMIRVTAPEERYQAVNRVDEHNRQLIVLVTRNHLRKICADADLPPPIAGIVAPKLRLDSVTLAPTPEVLSLAEAMAELPVLKPPIQRLWLYAKAHELLAKMFVILSHRAGTSELSAREYALDRARQAREILLADFVDPPTVRDLARRVGLSQRSLNQAFRALYGDTVQQCLLRWRLDRAQELLRNDALSIKQIAYQLGYKHPENFILAFTRCLDQSPTAFREQVISSPQ